MAPVMARVRRRPRRGRRIAGDDAADDIAVAAEVLGGAVERQRGAEIERMLQHRRGEGVVDQDGHVARRRDDGARCRRVRASGWPGSRARRARCRPASRPRRRRGRRRSSRRRAAPRPADGRCRRRAGGPRRRGGAATRASAASSTAVTAAMPDENATASSACSRRASASSNRATVGIPQPRVDVRAAFERVAAGRQRPRRTCRRGRCRAADWSTRGRGGVRGRRGSRDRRGRRARRGCQGAASSVPWRYVQ